MNYHKAISISTALLLLTGIAASAQVTINGPSEHTVAEPLELSAEAEGENIQELSIGYISDGGGFWTFDPDRNPKNCGGAESCEITAEYSADEEGEVTFKALAETYSGNAYSEPLTVEFDESSDEGGSGGDTDEELSAEFTNNPPNEVEVGEEIQLNGKITGENLQEISMTYVTEGGGHYTFNPGNPNPKQCTSSPCDISIAYTPESDDSGATLEFRVKGESLNDIKFSGSEYVDVKEQPQNEKPEIDLRHPSDGEDYVSRNPLYKWKITDEDDHEMEDVKLYVEEKDFPGDEPWNVPEHTYDVSDDVGSVESFRSGDWLEHGQEYVWGIKADDGEHTVKSEVYSFATKGEDDDDHDEGSLTVTVRDGENDRLENAYVKIQNGDHRTGRTDYHGEAEFVSLDPDWYDIRVKCDGELETDSVHVGDDEDEEVTINMDRHSSDDYCGDDDSDKPEAFFTISDSSPEVDEDVRFDASGSDGDIMEYRWAFPDGTTKYGEVVYKSFDSTGKKNVQLRVTEYDYDQDRTSRELEVQRRDDDDREEPVARLDIDPSSAEIGEEVEFDATDSSDNEDIEEYRFDLDGDGDWDIENDDGEVERTFFEEFDGFARVEVEDEDGNTDIDSEHYEVRSRGRVAISDVRAPRKVCDGESIEVEFSVRNLGDDDRYVVVEGEGFGETRSAVTELEEDEEDEMTITFNAGEAGSKSFTLSASNSNVERRTVEVLDCGDQDGEASDISVSVTPTRVNAGEAVKVSGYVEDARGRQNVRILMDGSLVADTSTSPDGYYQVYAYPEEVGRSSILASSEGVNARTSVEVLPTVQVSSLEVPENVFQGESFEVCGQVTTQVDALVLLRRNGEVIESKHGNGKVCFDTVSNTAGETQYSMGAYARGAGDSVSREVEILENKPETSSFPGKIASVESGDGIVKATIYNNHDDQRRYDVDLSGLPGTWVSTSEKQVILQPGEQREVFFYLTPQSEGRHQANIRIESQGSTIYDEDVEVITGGTSENQKRSIMWRLRDAVPWW